MVWYSSSYIIMVGACFAIVYSTRSVSFPLQQVSQARQAYKDPSTLIRREAGQCVSSCTNSPRTRGRVRSNANQRNNAPSSEIPPLERLTRARSSTSHPNRQESIANRDHSTSSLATTSPRISSHPRSRSPSPSPSERSSCIGSDTPEVQIDITLRGPCRMKTVQGRARGHGTKKESRTTLEVPPGEMVRKTLTHPNLAYARIVTDHPQGNRPGGKVTAQAIGRFVYAQNEFDGANDVDHDKVMDMIRQDARSIQAWGPVTGRKISDQLPASRNGHAAGAFDNAGASRAGAMLSSRAGVSLIVGSNWPSDAILSDAGKRGKPLSTPFSKEYAAVPRPKESSSVATLGELEPWPRRKGIAKG